MSIFEDTNPRELKTLLHQINEREAVLPDFQRDFVWDANATQELIVSIAFNYPAGSLLRIRNTKSLFACRQFEGAGSLDGVHPTFLVLDGQQRLTSLYQAFYGHGDHRYYLNLRKLMENDEFEECVFHLRKGEKLAKAYAAPEAQARDLVLPLSVLRGGAGEFGRWTRMVARTISDEKARIAFEDRVSEIEDKWIRTIDDYKFPVVTLSDTTSAEAVCTIFETLNRTGVKLTVFELLTARFWTYNIHLRQMWEQAKATYPIIQDFDIDPYYALQIVCLVSRATPSCKRGDVLNLNAEAFNTWWERSIQGLAKALEILRDDCGIIVPRWLPFNTIVVPFGAVLAKHEDLKAAEVGATRRKLCRWYWCSVFAQTYDKSANSASVKDLNEILSWLGGGPLPETVAKFNFDPSTLRETTTRQRAIYRGVISLMMCRNPRDFHKGSKITGDLMIEQNIDDHHIFPQAWLERQNVPATLRNCILNRTLIDRATNIRIQDRAPSEYLGDMRKLQGDETFFVLLGSHLLPVEADSPLLLDDFEGFLRWRENAVWEEIKRVTGYVEPSTSVGQN